MNSFQIIGKDNQPLTLRALDSQASGFWNSDSDPKWYAAPKCSLGSWYDNIGWAIAHQSHVLEYGINNWNTIKQYMLECHTGPFVRMSPEEAGVACCKIMRTLKPYFDLIDHWKSLGYTPKQITD